MPATFPTRSNWVRLCTSRDLWHPNSGWRKLIRVCRESNQVRSTFDVATTRRGIVTMVKSKYCGAEEEYRCHKASAPDLHEAILAERVREIISKYLRHEHKSIAIGRLLDFAIKLSAYE